MGLMIHDGTIVTMSPKGVIKDGAVVVEDDRIIDLGKTSDLKRKYLRYERINAEGKVVVPGLVNTHQHAAMSLLRGYADDCPLKEWLEMWVWPLERHMTGHDIYVGALLTAVESIMGGITTVNTMYHYMADENEAKAFAEAGLRGVVGHVCFSWRKEEDRRALWNLAKDWHGKANGTMRVSVDPHAPYTVDPEYMRELREETTRLNIRYGSPETPIMWHMHVAETEDEPEKIRRAFKIPMKGGVFEYLDSLGVLGDDVLAVHCVSLTEGDIRILRDRKVKVSHNSVSNLKLASGVSPVAKMLEGGVNVSLGTDGPSSNNVSDMFEVMKTTALLHKGVNKDPTLLPAGEVLKMGTINGAEALLWDKQIGSIETGKKADLVILDFEKPHLCPVYNEISHLVYSAKASDVDTVLINGKIVMEERELKTIDVEKILEKAEKTKDSLLSRLMQEK